MGKKSSRRRSENPRISVCLIARNEERFLAQCLKSVQTVAAEIVVVDTGSTDRTVEIAESFGAKVGHFEWKDDFASARNASLDLATMPWAFVIDADEKLMDSSVASLLRAIEHNPPGRGIRPFQVSDGSINLLPARIFPRGGVRFRYRLHEQPFENGRPLPSVDAPQVRLWHFGTTAEVRETRAKVDRNLRIARLQAEEMPDDPHAAMCLFWALIDQDSASDEAVAVGNAILQRFGVNEERTIYLLFRAHRARKEEAQAQRVLELSLSQGSRHRYFLFERARHLVASQRAEEALALLDEALAQRPEVEGNPRELTQMIRGVRGVALEAMLDLDGAKREYRWLLSERPGDPRAMAGLQRVEQLRRALAGGTEV